MNARAWLRTVGVQGLGEDVDEPRTLRALVLAPTFEAYPPLLNPCTPEYDDEQAT